MAKNEIEYTAINGMTVISTANESLSGSGTMGSVISGSGDGIRIYRVYIKAQGDVTQGMVRLFLDNGTNTRLLKEVSIPTVDQRSVTESFSRTITFSGGFFLSEGWTLKASTQKGETFNVVAEGVAWTYPFSETKLEEVAASSTVKVDTANSNLNGTGTLSTLISGSDNGVRVDSIVVKALGSTNLGMVRLFLYNGTDTRLFLEIPVVAVKQHGEIQTFKRVVNFKNGLNLKSKWSVKVSTEIGNSFSVSADAISWDYV